MDPGSDPEIYAPLHAPDTPPPVKKAIYSMLCSLAAAGATVALLLVVLLLAAAGSRSPERAPRSVPEIFAATRGVSEGVSEKSTGPSLRAETETETSPYPWTNAMLAWQRTGFHFQPQKNWMNDPDAPLYHKGWYHLFYQYNPDSAVWGNITWGHAVSRDLIHWLHLPLAMVPDHWYDLNGVWTGSATRLPPDNRIVILYTGSTVPGNVQVQNLAVPADPSDPLLLRWTKSDSNPVLVPPPGIGPKDFRDPTTAWHAESSSDSAWRVAIGSKNDSDHAGIALLYVTTDFVRYRLLPGMLHEVAGTGMWECLDFYPISTTSANGLDTSAGPGEGVRHVLKASLDDEKHDYYAIGVYDVERDVWVPDDPDADVGIGLRVDYGNYYASKTFYDEVKRRRVLFGYVGETDSERTDLLKGWASVQSIPRTVVFDNKTGSNLLQWPVEEVESLRLSSEEFADVALAAGSVMPLHVHEAVQLDITAEFEMDSEALAQTVEADAVYNCSTSGGAAERSALGPFGLLVLADEDLTEQTAVYFYVGRGTDGGLRTFFCQDELRSSKANDLVKRVYGSTVPVLDGEKLSVRILVDHSIVESFSQGGRTCITSRVYPTKAIYGAARVLLFNNATDAQVTAKSIKIWQMSSASIRPFFSGHERIF